MGPGRNMLVDVLVVGGGPAGAAAAIRARAAGLSAMICDRAVFPRDKTCGDGLTSEALRLLARLRLDPAAVPSFTSVYEVVIQSPSGRVVELPLPADGLYAAVAPRAELDAALFALAGRWGADLRPGAAVDALRVNGSAPIAELSDGSTVRARHVIAADGMYSTVRKLVAPAPAGGPSYLGEWHAFRQYFSGVADERLWVLFEEDLLPGYAWVFPLGGGRANVGFGIPRTPGVTTRAMAATWRDLLERPTLRSVLGDKAEPEAAHRAWPIPADLGRVPLTAGPVLFAGDAAGATDPMTGEGIAQALQTGILAAEAVAAEQQGRIASAAHRYSATVEHHLGRDLRFAARLGRILGSTQGARGAVHAAGLSPWTRRNFARWLFEDYPRALLLTPDRWRRGGLRPPPARFD